jgi:hypothetical protein
MEPDMRLYWSDLIPNLKSENLKTLVFSDCFRNLKSENTSPLLLGDVFRQGFQTRFQISFHGGQHA